MGRKIITCYFCFLSFFCFLTNNGALYAQNNPSTSCEVALEMYDQYGDGWNNALLSIYQHDTLVTTVTMNNGRHQTINILLDVDSVHLSWQSGWYDSECLFYFINDGGDTLYASPSENDGGMSNVSGEFGSFMMRCPTCIRTGEPYLISRNATQLVVGWAGTTGASYRVEYAPYGTSNWTALTTNNNTLTINGLMAGQVETVRVRRICGAGDTSGAKEKSFITP